MKKSNPITYLIKYSLWGLLFGFLILFFMPESRLSFNWQSAQQAWNYLKTNSQQSISQIERPLSIEDISFSEAVERASPSVVSVNVYRPKGLRDSEKLAPDEKILDVSVGIGSGVILSSRGYIVTNYHVIKDSDQISVNFTDGRRRLVEVVGFDKETDIAVLKTDIKGLIPAQLATDNNIRKGDIVMAIGNPFALDRQSVSLGIVSDIILPMRIQTDAAINTGNSGGALINLHGEVVAINSRRFSSRGGGQTGLNYAIPSVQIKRIAESIILYGKVRSNWLGLSTGELTRRQHEELLPSVKFATGIYVSSVEEGSPADIAGIKPSDFITRFNEQGFSGAPAFYQVFYATPLAKKVDIELIREGKLLNLSVQLFEVPERKN